MFRTTVNVSGAAGSGNSTKIYETPDYKHPWHGACVMHGSYTAEPTAPEKTEIVELRMPGISIRVRADDVRPALQALIHARGCASHSSSERADASFRAFNELRAAVVSAAGRHITDAMIIIVCTSDTVLRDCLLYMGVSGCRLKRKSKQGLKIVRLSIPTTHDPYDSSIGGPNDYAYRM